jgi:hypothetical protein
VAISMGWFPWFYGTPLDLPFFPSTTLDGRPTPTELDVALIELIYLVIADEQRCTECGHRLGRGLRARNASDRAPSRWSVLVDTRCWGWRRHPHVATVTQPANDLVLGHLELKARCTRLTTSTRTARSPTHPSSSTVSPETPGESRKQR